MKQSIITKFCIMHHNDPNTNTYRGVITSSPCKHKQNWEKYYTFYALSPMIRPIPNGLKLINTTKINKYPYNTTTVDHAYDPFDIQKNAVYFITWTQPVPATVPLYIHISPDGNSYPSFNKNPPSIGNWSQDPIGPLYVLVDTYTHPTNLDSNNNKLPTWKIDSNGNPIFLFSKNNNRCIPNLNGISLEQCFLETDLNILGTNKNTGQVPLILNLESLPHNSNIFYYIIPITILIIFIMICIFYKNS